MNNTEAPVQPKYPTQLEVVIEQFVAGFRTAGRSPILENPGDYGLEYENVWFPAEDGVPLEAWYVPRAGSKKLIIANHPKSFNRYGFASHLQPWKQFGAIGGNDFEVNFVKDIKVLHEAGYNVLTYDMRNHGHSGASNGGIPTSGTYEYRDVIGSLNYARSRRGLKEMSIGLFSRCFGCNSTITAMANIPEAFADVRCMIACQPLSPRIFLERTVALMGHSDDITKEIERRIKLAISFDLDQFSPVERAKTVAIPTFMYQVREDLLTRPSDVQKIFDNVSATEKELFWIEGTSRRWDGYNYFHNAPRRVLRWLAKYM